MARALQLEARYGRRRRAGHLAHPRPVRRQPGRHPRRLARLVRRAARGAGAGPGRAAGGDPPPARGLRPDRHAEAARAVRDRVLAVGLRAGLFDAAPANAACRPRASPLPRHAPQLAASLPAPAAGPHHARSAACRRRWSAWDRSAWKPCRRSVSLAMLVADAASREIRALFAGAWRDEARAGALDLTSAVRSPGSALKPFIYAMAFADGIAAPDTVVPDLPRRFGGYAPENFDRGFAGSITAAEALRRSLNLPAVALLDRVGPLRFAATLSAAGATLRLPPRRRSVAAAGAGRRRHHAARRGRPLCRARHRRHRRPAAPARRPTAARPRLPCTPAPRAQVADVLTRPLPEFGPRGIAWKTGTSWGGRDAWAFGFDRAPCRRGVDRTAGRHAAARRHRRLAGPAAAGPGVRPAAESPAQRDRRPGADTSPAPPDHRRAAPAVPAAGAVLSADGPVTIRVMGGRRPLTFLVDGAPLPDRSRPARGGLAAFGARVLPAHGAGRRWDHGRATVQVRATP